LLVGGPDNEQYLAWSPDGSKVAFWRGASITGPFDDTEIWVADRDGSGNVHRLTNDTTADFYGPTWSRDGGQIACESQHSQSADIWNMEANGTRRRNVTADAFADFSRDRGTR
jgi:Tol biopolymer transport system component